MAKLSNIALFVGSIFSANALAMSVQPDPLDPSGYVISKAEVQAVAAAKTADPMYAKWAQDLQTIPNHIVDLIRPNALSNPDNVKRVERVFTQNDWNHLTQMSAPEYTYTRLLQAIGKFPAFCKAYSDGQDSDAICQKLILTVFAHLAQDNGAKLAVDDVANNPLGLELWQQGLVKAREDAWLWDLNQHWNQCNADTGANARWPCYPGQFYFGRGAQLLTHHYQYGEFSEVIYEGDASVLLQDPDLVADSWLNLATVVWYYLKPESPKPSIVHVIDRTWAPTPSELKAGIGFGFGTTTNIINGGLECGERNGQTRTPSNRTENWKGLADYFQVTIHADENESCDQQTPYGSLSFDGAQDPLYTYWDVSWKYSPDRPEGFSFECDLVGFRTIYSALVPSDYEKCVTNHYGSHAFWPNVRVVDVQPTPQPLPQPPVSELPVTPPSDLIVWISGETKVKNGDKVVHKGNCYVAKNTPGSWDTPNRSGWFWNEVTCP